MNAALYSNFIYKFTECTLVFPQALIFSLLNYKQSASMGLKYDLPLIHTFTVITTAYILTQWVEAEWQQCHYPSGRGGWGIGRLLLIR